MKAAMRMRQKDGAAPLRALSAGLLALVLAAIVLPAIAALAGSREQAKRLHDRLNGAPPSQAMLDADAGEDRRRRREGRGAARDRRPERQLLLDRAQELRDAVDEHGPDRLRAAQRLHRDRHRHGARRRAVQHACCRPTSSMSARAASALPAYSNVEQRSLRAAGGTRRQPARRAAPARRSRRRPGCRRGHRRRDDDARRGARVLHRRHEPRDVPLHDDQPHVHGPAAGAWTSRGRPTGSARTSAAARAATAACSSTTASAATPAWTRWPRPSPTTTTSTTRPPTGAIAYTPGTVQRQVPPQHRQLPARFRHAGRSLGQPLARRARTR